MNNDTNTPTTLTVDKHQIWFFTDILAMTGIAILLLSIGGGILFASLGDELDSNFTPTLMQSFGLIALEIIVFGGAIGAVGAIRRVHWSKVAHLRPMTLAWWVGSFFIGLGCIPLVNLVAASTQQLLNNELDTNPQLEVIIPEGFSWIGLVGMALSVGILIPFVEELFFRGVLFTWLRQHQSFFPAALLSSALFGLFHFEPFLIAGTAVLGFISAWAMEKSGSLWAAVIIHGLNNLINVILAYLLLG